MTNQPIQSSSIFREAAIQAYISRNDEIVTPEAISPLLMRGMWFLIVVLCVALVVIGAPFISMASNFLG